MASVLKNSYNPNNQFSCVVFQTGKEVCDFELNEAQDNLRGHLYSTLRDAVDGSPAQVCSSFNDGFQVRQNSVTPSNTSLTIRAGTVIAGGLPVMRVSTGNITINANATGALRWVYIYLTVTEVEVADPNVVPQLGETTRRRQITPTITVAYGVGVNGIPTPPTDTAATVWQGGTRHYLLARVRQPVNPTAVTDSVIFDARAMTPAALSRSLATTTSLPVSVSKRAMPHRSLSVGDGVTSYGDFTTIAAAIEFAAAVSPNTGLTLLLRGGSTFTMPSSFTGLSSLRLVGEGASGALVQLTSDATIGVSFTADNISFNSSSTNVFTLTYTADVRLQSCLVDDVNFVFKPWILSQINVRDCAFFCSKERTGNSSTLLFDISDNNFFLERVMSKVDRCTFLAHQAATGVTPFGISVVNNDANIEVSLGLTVSNSSFRLSPTQAGASRTHQAQCGLIRTYIGATPNLNPVRIDNLVFENNIIDALDALEVGNFGTCIFDWHSGAGVTNVSSPQFRVRSIALRNNTIRFVVGSGQRFSMIRVQHNDPSHPNQDYWLIDKFSFIDNDVTVLCYDEQTAVYATDAEDSISTGAFAAGAFGNAWGGLLQITARECDVSNNVFRGMVRNCTQGEFTFFCMNKVNVSNNIFEYTADVGGGTLPQQRFSFFAAPGSSGYGCGSVEMSGNTFLFDNSLSGNRSWILTNNNSLIPGGHASVATMSSFVNLAVRKTGVGVSNEVRPQNVVVSGNTISEGINLNHRAFFGIVHSSMIHRSSSYVIEKNKFGNDDSSFAGFAVAVITTSQDVDIASFEISRNAFYGASILIWAFDHVGKISVNHNFITQTSSSDTLTPIIVRQPANPGWVDVSHNTIRGLLSPVTTSTIMIRWGDYGETSPRGQVMGNSLFTAGSGTAVQGRIVIRSSDSGYVRGVEFEGATELRGFSYSCNSTTSIFPPAATAQRMAFNDAIIATD